jgi:hypothetical protein
MPKKTYLNKMIMKSKIATFLFIILGLTSCNWIPPSPNEPFFCKINGKNFRPEKDSSPIGGIGSDPLNVTFDPAKGSLAIYVRNNSKFVGLRLIFSDKIVKVGEIKLSSDKNASLGLFSPDYNAGAIDIYSLTGVVNITKIENKEISGTFEFTCKSQFPEKEYKITKGCFNKLTYY